MMKMLPRKREGLPGPAPAHDLQSFLRPGRALSHWDLKRGKIVRLIADADTQYQPPLRRQVDDRAIFGHVYGVMQRQKKNASANLNARRLYTNMSRHQQRIGQISVFLLVMLRNEAAIPAAGFDGLSFSDDFIEDARHIGAGRGVLRAGKITHWEHDLTPLGAGSTAAYFEQMGWRLST